MSLKQSIVIVNEFTVKTKSGGTRGKTPGDYVKQYMARNKATETLTPVKLHDADTYIRRYMARSDAAERMESVRDGKEKMRSIERYGGVAFGYGDISLSDEKLEYASDDIQKQFEGGKTVMKTVISFDQEYLVERKLVDSNFVCEKRGDYRGNLDQMKLRMAIMNGLEKMSRRGFDDLQYVGVIQVDTEHVHCHLAMVDRGKGRMVKGEQKGMITETMKRDLRRGIDMFLDEKQLVQQMTSNITQDRRNARCFIKRFTHRMMEENGPSQFLLACLPDDKRQWRADSNRKEMRKANTMVREYVEDVLAQPGSGYSGALRSIDNYARKRQAREGLGMEEYRKLYQDGRERLIKDCMNGVYQVLREVPEGDKDVRTPLLRAMAQDYETMAEESLLPGSDPMIEFGFKLRSYSSRLQHHKKERDVYHSYVETYDTGDNDESAKPFIDFLRFEEEYNAQLMAKYQHFLSFLPPGEEYEEAFEDLMQYKRRMERLDKMRADSSLKRMTSGRAEDYGLRVYEMSGGQYAAINPKLLEVRSAAMHARYAEKEEAFRYKIAEYGLTLNEDEKTGRLQVSRKVPYAFDDVKALDIHHMQYDFPYDLNISPRNVDAFVETADRRDELYQGACAYLRTSKQERFISALPGRDIGLMRDVARQLRGSNVLPAAKPTGSNRKSGKTVRLTRDFRTDMDLAIRASVQSVTELDDGFG